MKEHKWVMLNKYYGCMGWNEFHVCTECGADGGTDGTKGAFIADGSGVRLSMDCDEAMLQIEKHPGRPVFEKSTRMLLRELWDSIFSRKI